MPALLPRSSNASSSAGSRAADRSGPARLAPRLRRARRKVMARRRSLAAVFAALAVLAGIRAASADPQPSVPVLVAATDLPGGATLDSDQLTVTRFLADSVPDGTLTAPEQAAGRVLAAPLERGEPVTGVRLVHPGLLEGYPGLVAAPVRIADSDVVDLLQVGDRVDLVATDPEGTGASLVVGDAPVIAVPAETPEQQAVQAGGLVLVAVPEDRAVDLARLAVSRVMSVYLTPEGP